MTYLEQVDRLQQRRRVLIMVTIAVVLVVVVVVVSVGTTWLVMRSTGGTDHGAAPASPAQGTAVTTAPEPSASQSPALAYGAAHAACQRIAALTKEGTLAEDMERLRSLADDAGGATDTDVSLSGKLLRRTAELAIAAKGAGDEAKLKASTVAAAKDLGKACVKAGY